MVIKYLVSMSTEMQVLVLHSFLKKRGIGVSLVYMLCSTALSRGGEKKSRTATWRTTVTWTTKNRITHVWKMLRHGCVWVKMISCKWKKHLKVYRSSQCFKGEAWLMQGQRAEKNKFAFMSAVGSWRYLKQRLIQKCFIFFGWVKKALITVLNLKLNIYLLGKRTFFLLLSVTWKTLFWNISKLLLSTLVVPSMLHHIVLRVLKWRFSIWSCLYCSTAKGITKWCVKNSSQYLSCVVLDWLNFFCLFLSFF